MAHSSSEQPQKISLSELEQVLAQARDEGWSELALISRSLAGWANVLAQWSGSNAFAIDPLDTVAVTKLSSLTGLTSLGLIGHGIGAEGARALASLTSLTSLNLGTNGIGAEGARALLDAWVESPTAKRLSFLDLRENGDLSSVLPAEALDTTNAQAILAAYRRYRSAWNIQAVQPLNEAKLLVVGNEAVGKTSLIRYLIKNEPRNPSEPKTPGAAMHEQIDTQAWSPAVDGVTGQTQRDRPKGDPENTEAVTLGVMPHESHVEASVEIAEEDLLAVVPPLRDVVRRTHRDHASDARHVAIVSDASAPVNCS